VEKGQQINGSSGAVSQIIRGQIKLVEKGLRVVRRKRDAGHLSSQFDRSADSYASKHAIEEINGAIRPDVLVPPTRSYGYDGAHGGEFLWP